MYDWIWVILLTALMAGFLIGPGEIKSIRQWFATLAGHILPDPKPELDLERLQLSAEAVAGMEALGEAMRASKVTVEELSEPYQPQPEYEQMLPAPADWKPE